MRSRFLAVLGVLAGVLLSSLGANAALATPPPELGSGYVTDLAGVLSTNQIESLDDDLAELAEGDYGDLYVVFVDTFSAPTNNVQWADEVALRNGLGTDQIVLAIAVDSRQYAWSVDVAHPLSDSQLDRIDRALTKELADSDWAGAIRAAIRAYPGGGSPFGWLISLIVVAAVIVAIVLFLRSRKKKGGQASTQADPNDPFAGISDDDLAQQADAALVKADDVITSAKQELGFATAQFGDAATASFTQVIADAKQRIEQAFGLKQKIDDEIPDTDAQKRAWHTQIIQLCQQADALIAQNVEGFDELRKLEADAPAALDRLRVRRAAAQPQLAAAPAALAALSQTYDAATLSPVSDNPAQAQARLQLADTKIGEAEAAIAAGDAGAAAVAIRTAEQAVEQAEQLAGAVTSLAGSLTTVEQHAQALIADLEADLATAARLSDERGVLAGLVAGTRTRVDEARTGLAAVPRNPQQILDTLTTADEQMDQAIAQARDAEQKAQRVTRLLETKLSQASSQIATANDFIYSRRGAIGPQARTRLAEAQASFNEANALRATSPDQALERATRAYNLASQATSIAQTEMSTWNGGGYRSSYSGGSVGSGLGGDILGGIIGGLLSGGGGSSRGGWGSSGGSSWGGGRSSSRSSSSSRRSFGGSSRGRSRGGRF